MQASHSDDGMSLSRRRFFQSGAVAIAAPAIGSLTLAPSEALARPNKSVPLAFASDPGFMETVADATKWIDAAERQDERGTYWLPEPDFPEKLFTQTPTNTIYSGSGGVVLFFIQLANVTGNAQYLEKVSKGAEYLAATWRDLVEKPSNDNATVSGLNYSLYCGIAGVAYILNEASKATGKTKYRDAAVAASDYLISNAKHVGAGIGWSQSAGVIGDSGTVLYLLYAAREFGDRKYLDAAAKAGDRLLELAIKRGELGLSWNGYPPLPGLPKDPNFPGFEAGTAGVAYTFARLYDQTKDPKHLAVAKLGADYLMNIATVKGNAALVPYQLPENPNTYYLGWCHGPAGTARTFFELHRLTGEPKYKMWVDRLAQGLIQSGAPENRTLGYWNTVSQCCGNGAFIEFFLSLWASSGKPEYLAHARRCAKNLVSRGTNFDGKGMRWDAAYTRIQPNIVTAETGYLVGSSGIAAALLRMHLAEQGKYQAVLLPDNPFPTSRRV